MAADPVAPSCLGLVYEIRGRLGIGRRLGICIDEDPEALVLHVSKKDKELTRLPRETQPTADVPADLGAAARLLYAAALVEPKAWDRDVLRGKVVELCGDVRVLRRLLDESLQLGWSDIAGWVPLTSSERAWRMAHHASEQGDLDGLHSALQSLPTLGYGQRATLLLPHVAELRRDGQRWRAVVDSMVTGGADRAELVQRLVFEPWPESLEAGGALLPADLADKWTAITSQLTAGAAISAPPSPGYRAWTALSLLTSQDLALLDSALDHIADLEPALLDDLIDEGRLTADANLSGVKAPSRAHLQSRLAPHQLSDEELGRLGHVGELARRYYLRRDRSALNGLEDHPRVHYYQALLDVVEGGPADAVRLGAEAFGLLQAPKFDLDRFRDGYTGALSDAVASDPSLWPMFTDLAVSGKLLADSGRSASDPLNAWIGLNRLLGLIWENSFEAAVEHGQLLLPHLDGERHEDEALSVVAFALSSLGRVDEALDKVDRALQGSYTENLLVNASVIASMAQPQVAVKLLARLVEEAPSSELQAAALSRAVAVWEGSDLSFPQVLVPALKSVMGTSLPIDAYLRYSDLILSVAPDLVASLTNPGGELSGPYAVLRAQARLKVESNYYLGNLAGDLIKVYRAVGRPQWFAQVWDEWVSSVIDGILVDFGDALGAADFVDKVLTEAPELFTQEQRFILAPRAGAHLNYQLTNHRDDWLTEQAWKKFFFTPIDEFLSVRHTLDRKHADALADDMSLCIGNAVANMIPLARSRSADAYNQLVERLRWDTANFGAITSQMRRLLDEVERGPLRIAEAALPRMRKLGSAERDELTGAVAVVVTDWREEVSKLRRNL